MGVGIAIGMIAVILLVALFLVFFLRGPLNSEDAHTVDRPPDDKK
ncbi:hypothetical protein [Lederbergia ruris]|uniref:Uncharacterized protein n=1 Tax=Lederbergia ruris TaxID=217495 RepID=A0ABQ4KPD6_9BACI|nr:hypothetical protein [Lederbergia ruris]GIN59795.1 hypothetical protein J8TS2_41140 [Lederbergia ruris]